MLPVLLISALLQAAPVAAPQEAASAPAAQEVAAPAAAAPPEPVPAPAPAPAPASAPTPLATKSPAVTVDAFHESQSGDGSRLESNIWSAFNARQSEAGPMEGTWIVTAAGGHKLVSLELRSDTQSHHLEGAWRSMIAGAGLNQSGFVSDLFLNGRDLEINCAAGKTRAPTVLEMRRDTDGQWRGSMLDAAGHKVAVVMSHATPGT